MPEKNILDDAFFMREALKEAGKALEAEEIPVGAVIACHNEIIARSHNQVEMLHDPTAHAEILAITAATHHLGNKFLTGCTLYVTVEPCVMCAGALFWSRIDRIVFATADEKRGYRLFYPGIIHPKTKVTKGILQEEARSVMDYFFKKLRGNQDTYLL